MKDILLVGAGKIGSAVARFLAHTGDFDVLVGDVDEASLSRLNGAPNLRTQVLDSSNLDELSRATHGRQSVLSALNYALNEGIARTALRVAWR